MTGYRIERCQGAGCTNFAQIATAAAPARTYSDTGLTPSTQLQLPRPRRPTRPATSAPTQPPRPPPRRRPPTRRPPTAPGTLTATAITSSRIDLELGRGDRQRRRHRLPDRALPGRRLHELRPDRAPTGTAHHLQRHRPQRPRPATATGSAPPTPPATSAPTRNIASATTPAPPTRTPPSAPGDADRDRGQQRPDRSHLGRGDRQRRRHRLPDRALPGRRLHQLRPDRRADRHRHHLQRHQPSRPRTSYSYRVRATDAAGNLGPYSQHRHRDHARRAAAPRRSRRMRSTRVRVRPSRTPPGTATTARSPNTTWATAGKYGKALSFNGTSSRVTDPRCAPRCT